MGRSNGPLRRQHQAVYRTRRKLGLKPLKKPWDYLTSAEVKAMAWQAYRVAAWELREAAEGGEFDHQRLREMFAESLAEMFKDAVSAHAVLEGGAWPVTPETPPYRNYPRVWEMLTEDVPASWRPEYPMYAFECTGYGAAPHGSEAEAEPDLAANARHVGALDAAAAVSLPQRLIAP